MAMTWPVSGIRRREESAMFDASAPKKKIVEVRDLKMHFPIFAGVFRKTSPRARW